MGLKDKNLQKRIIDNANQIASDAGYENAQDLINAVNGDIDSNINARQVAGRAAAQDFTSKLLKLCLYQEIKPKDSLTRYQWINRFDDQKLEYGNSKEYINPIITGLGDYDENNFIPTKATLPKTDAFTVSFYKDDGSLSDYASKKLKNLTILPNNWFPYFKSGKLMEFINKQIELMNQTLFIYKFTMFQNIFKKAIGDNGIAKKITGTANNIFTCFTNEIFPEIEKMQFYSKEYAYDNTVNTGNDSYPTIVNNASDLIMIMNNQTYSKFVNGAMGNQLMNKLVDFNNILPKENIISVGKELVLTNDETNLSVGTTDLLGEDKVVVMHKDLFNYIWTVDVNEVQHFSQNLATQHSIHLWSMYATTKWAPAFIYTNENLKTLPLAIA